MKALVLRELALLAGLTLVVGIARSADTATDGGTAPAKVAAKPVMEAFATIIYNDSGGFTGRGSGKWITISGDGKFEAKSLGGAGEKGQLKPEQLAELKKLVADVDWASIKDRYDAPGAADTLMNHVSVAIGSERHRTDVDELSKRPE
jgi:hypothetical protein